MRKLRNNIIELEHLSIDDDLIIGKTHKLKIKYCDSLEELKKIEEAGKRAMKNLLDIFSKEDKDTDYITINFSEFDHVLFTGRDKGIYYRDKYNLKDIDLHKRYNIIIPNSVFSITTSFFIGMFKDSVLKCGNKDKFFEVFIFKVENKNLLQNIHYFVDRIFRDSF